jgi:hypothetical protein
MARVQESLGLVRTLRQSRTLDGSALDATLGVIVKPPRLHLEKLGHQPIIRAWAELGALDRAILF